MSIIDRFSWMPLAETGLFPELALVAVVAVSVLVAVIAGVLPPRNVNGGDRIPPDRPASLLVAVLFGAMAVYLLAGNLYITARYPQAAHGHPPAAADYTPGDTAFVNTVPPLLGFLTLLLGGWVIRRSTRQDLGIDPRQLPVGVLAGLLGGFIIIPPLVLLEQVLEATYRAVHFRHETEHPLLHLLRARPGAGVTVAIVIGACLIAPLAEELLFRGYLQTLIRRMLFRLGRGRVARAKIQPEADVSPAAVRPTAWQTWLAILITSALFAWLHPSWTRPIIFLLSVCLGYAYERTGNLWVPVTIHAAFNTISTVIFLANL